MVDGGRDLIGEFPGSGFAGATQPGYRVRRVHEGGAQRAAARRQRVQRGGCGWW